MSTGMAGAGGGHWFIWGILGAMGLVALFAMVGWMRREKEKTIAYTSTGGSNSMTTETTTTSAKVQNDPETYYAARKSTQASGWGFWPWALISALILGALAWLIWNSSISSGTTSIKWILYSLLGIGGLLSIAGIGLMTRKHPLVDEKRGRGRGLGFLTFASGLMLALASLFVWAPKFAFFNGLQDKVSEYKSSADTLTTENVRLTGLLKSSTSNGDEVTRLNGVVERLNGDNSIMKGENSRLKGLLANNRTSADEVTRLNGVIARLNEDKTTMGSENTRLKGLLSSNRTDGDEVGRLNGVISRLNTDNSDATTENTRIKGLLGNYRNDSEVQSAKIASLEAELAKLRNKPAPAPVTTTTVKRRMTPLAIMHKYNQDETKLRLTSKDYNMMKMGHTELVKGKRGRYYRIALRNPANGKAYKFASGSYSKIDNDAAFKQSLDRVISDIRGAFDGKRAYQLYVQGKASAGVYNGRMAEGYDYSNIKALKKTDGSYGPEIIEKTYGPTINNDDLPNLRAAYLREFVGNNYKVTKPLVLDGKVSKSKKTSKQAVGLTLFVED